MFIDNECDCPGDEEFDHSDGSSCSDDEQHAGVQIPDEHTADGLYVTETLAHMERQKHLLI